MDFLEIQHTGHGGLRCMTPSKFWEPLHIFEAGEAMYFYFVHKLTILTYDKDSCVRMWDKLGFCRNIRRVHQTVPIHRETHQCHMRNEWLLLSGLSSPSRLRSLSTHTHIHIHTHTVDSELSLELILLHTYSVTAHYLLLVTNVSSSTYTQRRHVKMDKKLSWCWQRARRV